MRLLALALSLVLGCASSFEPIGLEQVGLLERSQTQQESGVRVTVAVPSESETRELFHIPLYDRGVQPVWIEIENGRESGVTFLSVGVDAEYFTPVEAATLDLAVGQAPEQYQGLASQYFLDRSIDMRVGPGETRSGFLFTALDEGTKAFNVDLLAGTGRVEDRDIPISFTFFVPVPGLRLDHSQVDWEGLYRSDELVDADQKELIAAIENAVCCTRDAKEKDWGDPLNLVVVGDIDDIYYAFLRAGWDETETTYRASAIRTVKSFFSGGDYRYSPVSSLYVFGRGQDVAFQKARDNIHERNHLRLWMSPFRFQGKPVWLGQISRDIGVRFTTRTITTHKIDPDVDETREYLVENLAYNQSLSKLGYVGGAVAAPREAPRANLTGDPYLTDGKRVVLWVTQTPTAIADIEVLDWGNWPTE
jgi:hypothetical protein